MPVLRHDRIPQGHGFRRFGVANRQLTHRRLHHDQLRLGIDEETVTSPTFIILHEHFGGRLPLYHLDLYRLAGMEQEEPALLEDYLGPGLIAFVEWPLEGGGALPHARLRVTLSHRGGDRRHVEVGGVPGDGGEGPTGEGERVLP